MIFPPLGGNISLFCVTFSLSPIPFSLYIIFFYYFCIKLQHQGVEEDRVFIRPRGSELCSVPTPLHQNLDSSKGIDPAFAMIVHDVSMFINYKILRL